MKESYVLLLLWWWWGGFAMGVGGWLLTLQVRWRMMLCLLLCCTVICWCWKWCSCNQSSFTFRECLVFFVWAQMFAAETKAACCAIVTSDDVLFFLLTAMLKWCYWLAAGEDDLLLLPPPPLMCFFYRHTCGCTLMTGSTPCYVSLWFLWYFRDHESHGTGWDIGKRCEYWLDASYLTTNMSK